MINSNAISVGNNELSDIRDKFSWLSESLYPKLTVLTGEAKQRTWGKSGIPRVKNLGEVDSGNDRARARLELV